MSLVLLVFAWRGSRAALGVLVGLRLLSAASAVPAFAVGGVPAPVQALAAIGIALTPLGCALVTPALRRESTNPPDPNPMPAPPAAGVGMRTGGLTGSSGCGELSDCPRSTRRWRCS